MEKLKNLLSLLEQARTIVEDLRNGSEGDFLKDFAETEEFDSIEECENIIDEFIAE